MCSVLKLAIMRFMFSGVYNQQITICQTVSRWTKSSTQIALVIMLKVMQIAIISVNQTFAALRIIAPETTPAMANEVQVSYTLSRQF